MSTESIESTDNRQILTGSANQCHVCDGYTDKDRYCVLNTGDVLCGECFDMMMADLERRLAND